MTLSELCIRRPVMTTLITASIIAFGVFGFRLLPVSALPKVDFPTIAVTATLPGASADTMAASAIDRRRHLVDVIEFVAGHKRHHHPVRPQSQHRCRSP
jgi:AcrB/AcrD/AcrF family protein